MKSRKYPVAAHSYFQVINKTEEKQRFLADDQYAPRFAYREYFDVEVVQGHHEQVAHDAEKQSLKLVLASIDLNQDEPDNEAREAFRALNAQLFGEPRADYTQAILARIARRVKPKTAPLWEYVLQHVDYQPDGAPSIVPKRDTFNKYRDYFSRYYDGGLHLHGNLTAMFGQLLRHTGLAEKGWTVRTLDDASHARVNHADKCVTIGTLYRPRTPKSAEHIVVHEIYGHALRGPQQNAAESEGVAVLLEQLLDSRFQFRRAYRYLAASLGWGTAGGPRTFRETYEIIWRLMVIAGRYNEEHAKSHAFDECTRVFRGGRPDIAGMVFLKDTIYFSANIDIWRTLSEQPLAYNELVDVIEGRRKILI